MGQGPDRGEGEGVPRTVANAFDVDIIEDRAIKSIDMTPANPKLWQLAGEPWAHASFIDRRDPADAADIAKRARAPANNRSQPAAQKLLLVQRRKRKLTGGTIGFVGVAREPDDDQQPMEQ
jgi:hypothetical protein